MRRRFVVTMVLLIVMVGSLIFSGSVVALAEEVNAHSYERILTPFAKIDAIVSRDVANGFPSAQLALIQHGKLVYSKAWGYARLYNEYGVPLSIDERVPATPLTLYDVGGSSEMFTAWFAAFKLISDGVLDFNTKIVDVLGDDFADATLSQEWLPIEQTMNLKLVRNWKRVLTVGDLLMNISGFPVGPNFHRPFLVDVNGKEMPNMFYNASGSREEALRIIKMMPLEVEPGTRVAASDVDAVVLTFVVEAASGKRLDEYLAEIWRGIDPNLLMVFNPLKNGYPKECCAATEISGNTRFGMVDFPGARTGVLCGEVHDETSYYGMEGISGNAGLFANAESLAKVLTTYLSADAGIFSEEVLKTMRTKADDAGTSMGWYVETDGSGNVVELWLNGFTRCYISVFPEADTVMVYLTNAIHSPVAFNTDAFAEYDLAHAKFAGTLYEAAKQDLLFHPDISS